MTCSVLLAAIAWTAQATSGGPSGRENEFLARHLEVVTIGAAKQLLVDDVVLHDLTNVRRVLHAPTKAPANPTFTPGPADEQGLLNPSQVLYDRVRGRFRLWYAAGRTDATQSIAYAESSDGIVWERCAPDPEDDETVDAPRSNRVWIRDPGKPEDRGFRCRDPGAIVLDPDERDATRRYKMIMRRGLPVAFSPDGFVWTAQPDMVPTYGGGKDENTFLHDRIRDRWVAFLRQNAPARDRTYLRRLLISASDDMVRWQAPAAVLLPDRRDGVGTSFWGCRPYCYEGMYVCLLGVYVSGEHHDRELRDTLDVRFAFSRDGMVWQRPDRRPFIGRGGKGAWDSGMTGPALMALRGDRLFFFYLGTAKRHRRDDGGEVYAIGTATLRADGFASLQVGEPADGDGLVLTRMLEFTGDRLYVNADARDGAIRVELLANGYRVDPASRDLRKPWLHEASPSDPITGDAVRHVVTWQGDAGLSRFAGRPVRLRFALSGGARLYAFQFAPHDAEAFDHELGVPMP